jgi:hypothetical protein
MIVTGKEMFEQNKAAFIKAIESYGFKNVTYITCVDGNLQFTGIDVQLANKPTDSHVYLHVALFDFWLSVRWRIHHGEDKSFMGLGRLTDKFEEKISKN